MATEQSDKDRWSALLTGMGVAFTDHPGSPEWAKYDSGFYVRVTQCGAPCQSHLQVSPDFVKERQPPDSVVGDYWMKASICFTEDGRFICIGMWD